MEADPQPGQRVIRYERVVVYLWYQQMTETGASEQDKFQ